jgi:hypothetical protein
MKLMNKRGQGTIEYLLMLAAVIIIVAVAVYYVTVIGSKTISASAKLKTSDNNTVWLRGESGSSVIAGWSFEYQKKGDNIWYSASGDFGPTIEIQLENLTGQISIGDNIVIRYDNSSNEFIVQEY